MSCENVIEFKGVRIVEEEADLINDLEYFTRCEIKPISTDLYYQIPSKNVWFETYINRVVGLSIPKSNGTRPIFDSL